jgi:RND family efflux transporter MFP subunit
MKRNWIRYGLVSVGFIVLAGGAFVGLRGKATDAPPSPPRPVRTVVARVTDVGELLQQTGEIQARRETQLSFQVGGQLIERPVEVGSFVKAGDTVGRLNDADFANEVRAAEAELSAATSAAEQSTLAVARARELLKLNASSNAEVEAAEANYVAATSKKDTATAALEAARRKLDYATLATGEAGVVTAVSANVGQVVVPAQAVVTIASFQEREAVFNVAESIVNTVPIDVTVEVALVSDAAIKTIGTVREVSPSADPSTRTFRVRISLPNAPEQMALGSSVVGRAIMPTTELIQLPAAAVTSSNGKPAVYVVDLASKSLVRREVVVARYGTSMVMIASGLTGGEHVVVAGVSKLRPGQEVRLEPSMENTP